MHPNKMINLVMKNITNVAPIRAEAKKDSSAAIYIYDVIMSEWGSDAKGLLQALAQVGRVDNLAVHINSPGGDVFEARAMGAILRATNAAITVYIDGLAASAASELALNLGGRVVMAKGSFLMIHNASTIVWGNKEDMRKTADVLGKIDETIASVYAEKTGADAGDIAALMAAETWLTAQESLDGKWIDAIEGNTVSNKFDLSVYNSVPKQLTATEQPTNSAPTFDQRAHNERRARLALAA